MIPTFASRLKQLRLNKNLRQEQVANLIGVNKSAISTYENNTRQPSFEMGGTEKGHTESQANTVQNTML